MNRESTDKPLFLFRRPERVFLPILAARSSAVLPRRKTLAGQGRESQRPALTFYFYLQTGSSALERTRPVWRRASLRRFGGFDDKQQVGWHVICSRLFGALDDTAAACRWLSLLLPNRSCPPPPSPRPAVIFLALLTA